MSFGVILLVHDQFDRVAQMARHWHSGGCPVVIHVDRKVGDPAVSDLRRALADCDRVRFSPRYRCDWGMWGIVAATQAAAELILKDFPEINHVFLASGSCLPLRPVAELDAYLAGRPTTDFIESATTADVPWTVGGLSEERFTLHFPLPWKRRRMLFDGLVAVQRRLGIRRRMPRGIAPHMGSQWWCLTRQTLTAILQDPDRQVFERFFKRVWIPDESYFQTLARLYSRQIESRSLTLSKFDFQGVPHIFYDDHLQLLRRSDCFVARKIWPRADRLYDTFLAPGGDRGRLSDPNPGKIDRLFARAVDRRVHGRPGLFMQSRFPRADLQPALTAAPYSVFEGFADLFENFEDWLKRQSGATVHGHLFAPEGAEFEERQDTFTGALSAAPKLRDYNPAMFLSNLVWNTRGRTQCFQFGPRDSQQISWDMAKDPNARISVVSGAWAVPLFRANADFGTIRVEAARLQKIEAAHLKILRSPYAKARIRIWTMAEFVEAPMEGLQAILEDLGAAAQAVSEAPRLVDLDGFGQFLQTLKNQGMHPYLMGDFAVDRPVAAPARAERKPYVIR